MPFFFCYWNLGPSLILNIYIVSLIHAKVKNYFALVCRFFLGMLTTPIEFTFERITS